MQASSSAVGIAKMYTHFGRPSKLLSSLVRISISSFIVLLFLVVNNVPSFALRLHRKKKNPANLTAGRVHHENLKNLAINFKT